MMPAPTMEADDCLVCGWTCLAVVGSVVEGTNDDETNEVVCVVPLVVPKLKLVLLVPPAPCEKLPARLRPCIGVTAEGDPHKE